MSIRPAFTQSLPHRHKTLFLSDLHMGAIGCRIDAIDEFLRCHTADRIFLVGDILDLWHPLRRIWSDRHEDVMGLLRQRAKEGAEIFYLVGNHDAAVLNEGVRDDVGLDFATVLTEMTHDAADGRRYLVLHGDALDARWLRWHVCTRIGSRIDGRLRALDAALRRLRRRVVQNDGRSAMAVLLAWVSDLIYAGQTHEQRLVDLARQSGHDGVICGHFHKAALHADHGLLYANCGDWVDSFTALVETDTGALRLIDASVATSAGGVGVKGAAASHALARAEGWR